MLGNADRFADGVRVIVIPASRTEYLKALRGGLIERFVEAGALVEAPCCGPPCMGGAFGLLAPPGEVSLSTSNRNFRGEAGERSGVGLPLLAGDGGGERPLRRDHRPEGGVNHASLEVRRRY